MGDEPGALSGSQGAVAGRSSASASVGPNRETAGGVVRSRNASSLAIAAPANAVPASAVNATADGDPDKSRRGRSAVPASSRRARPKPAKRLVPASASSHGYAASSDGINVCDPSASSWLSTPPIDGSSSRSEPTPRATTIG